MIPFGNEKAQNNQKIAVNTMKATACAEGRADEYEERKI
jgi:hypothetical protein